MQCFGTEVGTPQKADVPSAAMPAALHTVGRTFSFSLQPARLSCSTWLVVAYAMHALVAIFLLGDKNVDAYSMTMYALVAHWRTSLVGGPGWIFRGVFLAMFLECQIDALVLARFYLLTYILTFATASSGLTPSIITPNRITPSICIHRYLGI